MGDDYDISIEDNTGVSVLLKPVHLLMHLYDCQKDEKHKVKHAKNTK